MRVTNKTLNRLFDCYINHQKTVKDACIFDGHSRDGYCDYQNNHCDALLVFKGVDKHNKWPRVCPIRSPAVHCTTMEHQF